jgi:hypothetical protein
MQTTVVGTYKAEEYDDKTNTYVANPNLGIQIVVDVTHTRARIVNQKGAHIGKFTFTASESGDHAICLSTNTSGWFTAVKTKVHLDLMFGDSVHTALDHGEKEALDDLTKKVRDLNAKVQNIRREQVYQRERESEFREQSQATNFKVFSWTFVQLVVLGLTAVWQVKHLKTFFVSKKLV